MTEMLYDDLKEASGLAPGLAMQIVWEIGRRIVAGSYDVRDLVKDEGCSKGVVGSAPGFASGIARGSWTATC
jgi:hypothetical protein